MDTRFWGPSGWQLLHLIATAPVANPEAVYDWFHLLEFVLPCKYCRASFHDYMELDPLTLTIIKDQTTFSRWLFDIHNCVNDKLRGQGLMKTPNPSWAHVKRHWQKVAEELCTDRNPQQKGWDFLTSVAYATPDKDYTPVPMPDAPEQQSQWTSMTLAKRNRYNLLSREERLTAISAWWRLIPSILPCAAWREAWDAAYRAVGEPPTGDGASVQRGQQEQWEQWEQWMKWMWAVECRVCDGLQCATPHPSLRALQREVGAFESDCGKKQGHSKNRKTCRALKRRRAARRRLLQTRRIQMGGGSVVQ